MSNLGLDFVLKKGDKNVLNGKLIAYATVDDGPSDNSADNMARNGILAVRANYVDQRNIKDFFQAEFGVSLEKGIQEIIEQARERGGLEGALDPDVVRDKLESMRNMEFIPIPAKVAFFNSEEEILSQDTDVVYLGHFKVISHAHLCVNSFPILYQAKFREQEHLSVSAEIESMLTNLIQEGASKPKSQKEGSIKNFKGDIKEYLSKNILPNMLYNIENPADYEKAEHQFKNFMDDFAYPEDTQAIIELIKSSAVNDKSKLTKLELLLEKVSALQNEDYEQLENIKKKLKQLN